MAALTHGAALILQARFSPAEALKLIERERCTVIYTLPAITNSLLGHETFRKDRVRSLVRGATIGGPDDVRVLAEDMGVERICNIYGSTEVYGNCCVTPWQAPLSSRMRSQGPALPGTELRVVDTVTGAVVSDGTVGEIQVRGRVSPGYLQLDGRIQSIVDQDGWFATGDLGSLDTDKWLRLTGRATEMMKPNGINVSPLEVEEVLVMHPAIVAAAVVGVPHPTRGETVVAFVQRGLDGNISVEEVTVFCRQHLASYKVPMVFQFVDSFPHTSTGKLARAQLRQAASALPIGEGNRD
jgi:fatty-acyl-CoA synthase